MAKSIITEFRMPNGKLVRKVEVSVIKRALRAAGKVMASFDKKQATGED